MNGKTCGKSRDLHKKVDLRTAIKLQYRSIDHASCSRSVQRNNSREYIHMDKVQQPCGSFPSWTSSFKNTVNVLYVPPALKSGLNDRSDSSSVQQQRFSWNEKKVPGRRFPGSLK